MHLSNVFIDSIPPEYFDGGDGDYTVGIYSKLFEAIQEFATERMSDDTI